MSIEHREGIQKINEELAVLDATYASMERLNDIGGENKLTVVVVALSPAEARALYEQRVLKSKATLRTLGYSGAIVSTTADK
jgi:hypothetical protein